MTNTIKSFLYMVLLMLPVLLLGADSCEYEYRNYPQVKEYALRLKDKIPEYGCKVVKLYASLIEMKELYDVMDAIDDKPELIPPLMAFLSNTKLTKIFREDATIKKAILNDALNIQFLKNLNTLLKKRMNTTLEERIVLDHRYFNYFVLSAYYAKDEEEALKFYRQLKKEISVDDLGMFATILDAVKESYSFISFPPSSVGMRISNMQ